VAEVVELTLHQQLTLVDLVDLEVALVVQVAR
jgi:hypothetical protein